MEPRKKKSGRRTAEEMFPVLKQYMWWQLCHFLNINQLIISFLSKITVKVKKNAFDYLIK